MAFRLVTVVCSFNIRDEPTGKSMMQDLKIEKEPITENGINMLRLAGELDAHTFDELDGFLQDYFAEEQYKIVLDMSKVRYISSAGIGTLVSATMQCSSNGGNLILMKVSDHCREVLVVLGLHEILQFADDLQPALARF